MAGLVKAQDRKLKNSRMILTEEEKKEIKRRIIVLQKIEIATAPASSYNVQRPEKQTPPNNFATVSSGEVAFSTSTPRMHSSLDSTPKTSEFAFRAKSLPKLKVASIPTSFNIGLPKMETLAQEVSTSSLDKVVLASTPTTIPTPTTQGFPRKLTGDSHTLKGSSLALSGSPSALKDNLPAWNVQISFGNFDGTSLGTAFLSRWHRTNIFGRPHDPPAISSHALKDTKLASTASICPGSPGGLPPKSPSKYNALALSLNAILGSFGSLASTTPSQALTLKDNTRDSPPSASQSRSNDIASTPTLASASIVNLNSSSGLTSSTPALGDTGIASPPNLSPDRSSSLASTSSSAKAPPLGVDPEEPSSTNDKPATVFRLFDLPQELQDAILGFAYTEAGTKYAHKSAWETKQTHLRKTTRKPKVDLPAHKVN